MFYIVTKQIRHFLFFLILTQNWFFFKTEIPRFLSDEECEHVISLAKESGLAMSIAGFDVAAYEGDLDEDMREAGKKRFWAN